MKSNNLSIRAVLTAIGAMCCAITIPSISHAVGSVKVNGVQTCSAGANLAMDPSGDLVINCTAPGNTSPVCSVSISATAIATGQSSTISAVCNPAATSYAWTGFPSVSNAGATVAFATAGTFTYTVTGTNSVGTGPASAPASVVVTDTVAPTSTPFCNISVSNSAIAAGGTSTLTALCTSSPDGWNWSSNSGGPTMSGQSSTLSFPNAGTYTYTVTAHNTLGTGVSSPAVSVVVSGNNPTNCAAVAGTFSGNSTKLIAIDRGASVSYALPVYTSPGRTLEILSIQSTASQPDLTSEFSVSTCAGDYTNMQAECKTWGIVNQSGTQLYATTAASQVAGTCTLTLGTQYYLNVRNVKFDRVTPACTPQTCYMNVQLNSY